MQRPTCYWISYCFSHLTSFTTLTVNSSCRLHYRQNATRSRSKFSPNYRFHITFSSFSFRRYDTCFLKWYSESMFFKPSRGTQLTKCRVPTRAGKGQQGVCRHVQGIPKLPQGKSRRSLNGFCYSQSATYRLLWKIEAWISWWRKLEKRTRRMIWDIWGQKVYHFYCSLNALRHTNMPFRINV
jgi:hypothetical protein